MLVLVDLKSITKNLHYIHSKCNLTKRHHDILFMWENVGNKAVFLKSDGKIGTPIKCRSKLISILNNMTFRDANDIDLRLTLLPEFNDRLIELKEKMKFMFNIKPAAEILVRSSTSATGSISASVNAPLSTAMLRPGYASLTMILFFTASQVPTRYPIISLVVKCACRSTKSVARMSTSTVKGCLRQHSPEP